MRDLSTNINQENQKRKTKGRVTVYRFNIAVLSTLLMLSLGYLFTVNSLGTKGYEIKKLDSQVREMESELKTLQLQASDLQSITRIREQAQKFNYVPASNITYLKDTDFALR